MSRLSTRLCCLLLLAILAGCAPSDDDSPPPPQRILSIAPVAQQTSVWCWAATSEMIFRYYNMPGLNASSYQCGIIAVVFGGGCAFNCGLCTVPIGSLTNFQNVVNGYGWALQQLGVPSRSVTSRIVFGALSFEALKREVGNGRPVAIGFAPNGGVSVPNVSEHVSLVVGYDSTNGRSDVVVNDPYPYPSFGPDPYLALGATMIQPGQYRVPYGLLVGPMAWVNTLYDLRPL